MTDYFALLNQIRRPWLNPDELKTKFLQLSTETHPDRFHTASPEEKEAATKHFAELNSAYNCLRDPRTRLHHLLQLETGVKPPDLQQIPPDLADFFVEIAHLCRQVDDFLSKQAITSSPLLRAQLFERGQEWTERLLTLQQVVAKRQNELLTRLQPLDKAWLDAPPDSPIRTQTLDQIRELWRLLSFFARWTSQIHERIARIAI